MRRAACDGVETHTAPCYVPEMSNALPFSDVIQSTPQYIATNTGQARAAQQRPDGRITALFEQMIALERQLVTLTLRVDTIEDHRH